MDDVSPSSDREPTVSNGTWGQFADLLAALRHHVGMGWRRARVEYYRRSLQVRSARPIDGELARERLAAASDVLVLCAGNICRSPMAERYLRRRFAAVGRDDVAVTSAGFVRREDRPSPERAVRAAGEFDVDLSDYRSRTLTPAMLAESDLVFLMDAYNYDAFRRRFAGDSADVFFLKPLGPADGFEITDPHGTDLATFQRVYGEVAAAVDAGVASMEVDE